MSTKILDKLVQDLQSRLSFLEKKVTEARQARAKLEAEEAAAISEAQGHAMTLNSIKEAANGSGETIEAEAYSATSSENTVEQTRKPKKQRNPRTPSAS